MTRVKICGISGLDDARLAVELGAAALGFNFYPPSPRYIVPAAAAALIRQLPPLVMAVGVFADETEAGHVATLAHDARVDAVQLHGPRFPIISDALQDYPVIRAVTVRERRDLEELAGQAASGLLLDNFDPKLIGGTGRTIDWTLAREAKRYGNVILAGGLTPANVAQAIREVRPYAVDVASGVESAPGKKDPEKLRAFFAAVEEADRQH
ncbi:MAG TPA: phosphoribosylanthranilate isomerase [Terriglobia bacterium]|nr:phosphoribosylanthranilate isomerase [Terriglobia bacterium]